jgi:hypothetical protein
METIPKKKKKKCITIPSAQRKKTTPQIQGPVHRHVPLKKENGLAVGSEKDVVEAPGLEQTQHDLREIDAGNRKRILCGGGGGV